MATAKKPVKTSTSKKPSAAELARREAQSSKDKGDILEITVDGIKATLKQEWFNDYEIIASLPSESPNGFKRYSTRLMRENNRLLPANH